jgi:hypothetical protein
MNSHKDLRTISVKYKRSVLATFPDIQSKINKYSTNNCCFSSRSRKLSHLVRVGVSWKTTESSRASGLIAYEFHARTAQELPPSWLSPSPPLYQILQTNLAAKGVRRNWKKNLLCLCLVPTSPLRTKGRNTKQRQKRGAINLEQVQLCRELGWRKISREFHDMGWMEGRGLPDVRTARGSGPYVSDSISPTQYLSRSGSGRRRGK